MNLNERTMIITLARMFGTEGTNEEVYKKFWEKYVETQNQESSKQVAQVEVIKRVW